MTTPTFPVNSTASNSYPFVTKAQVAERLKTDTSFCLEALQVLVRRQTDDERETSSTKWKNRRGLMSSHAVRGTAIAAKLASGEELSPEETDRACEIASHYVKQLTAHYRAEQEVALDETERAKVKATFGV